MSTPVVMITGALTGIGRAPPWPSLTKAHGLSSPAAARKRARRSPPNCARGVEAEFVLADMRHDDEVRSLVDQTVKRFGRLDVAVNNAGAEGHLGPVTEQSTDSYAATFDTNVLGTLLSLKHKLRVMVAQGNGSIVNMSSALSQIGAPGASMYSASKHAVEGLTKSAALEVAGSGVRVNAVAPGRSRPKC